MAEYIDRYIIGGLVDCHNNVHYEDIKELPIADVIERSEYDKVLQENKQLKHIISDKVNEDLKCAFEIKELRSKIDKAIEEIKEGYYGNEEKSETDSERADAFNNGLSYALEILEENIGE